MKTDIRVFVRTNRFFLRSRTISVGFTVLAIIVFAFMIIAMWRGSAASAQALPELVSDKPGPALAPAATFTVTNTAVSGIGSLRQAIIDANGNAGADTIAFNIPASDPNCNMTTHVCTIKPTVDFPLPFITDRVTINGYSQPGASVNTLANDDDALLLIELDGSLHTDSNIGLLLQGAAAGQSVIKGLVIDNWGRGILTQTDSLAIEGCFIGIDPSGTLARTNDIGVFADFNTPTSGMRIGGNTPDVRNVISGNNAAIYFQSGSNHVVQGNFIGTNRHGTAAVANGTGIQVQQSDDALIGGTTAQERNIFAGNTGARGIVITVAARTRIQGNFIGTDVTGTVALGFVNNSAIDVDFASSGTQIGGLTSTPGMPPGNVISGGSGTGLQIGTGSHNVSGTTVMGNLIGTDASGANPLGNLRGVVFVDPSNTIGGTDPMARNVISGNGTGIVVIDTTAIAILGNSIHSNGGLGIDLGSPGVTQNDPCDGDTGANDQQNFPVITSATFGSGMVTVSGTLDSLPSMTYRLEFFSSAVGDPSGNGEGKTFLGAVNVVTDASCHANFTSQMFPIPADEPIVTATATRLDGTLNPIETSEFSAFFVPPPVSVSGKVLTPDGRGLRNAIVKLINAQNVVRTVTTSSFGFYFFDNVQPGQTYTIGVLSKLYRFSTRSQPVGSESIIVADFVGRE